MSLKRYLILSAVLLIASNSSAEGLIDITSGTSAEDAPKSFLEILFKSISSDNDSIINETLIEKLIEDNEKLIKVPEAVIENPSAEPAELPRAPAKPAELDIITETTPAVSYIESVDIESVEREMIFFDADGEGWTLEDYTNEDGEQADGLKYSGREYIGGNTVFSFYPYAAGRFFVNIRRTDYTAGTIEKKRYVLNVSESVTQEILETSTEIAAVKAELVQETVNVETIEMPEPVEEVEIAIVDSGIQNILNAESLEAAGDCSGAAELLDKCLQNSALTDTDAVLFKLAGYYENCSIMRDERKAVKLYSEIVDYYPVSNYWVEAKEKIIYLERNFIYIR